MADDLHAGRTPRTSPDALTVAERCNRFLTAKLHKKEAGELGERMFADYKQTTDRLVTRFGKTRRVADLAVDDFDGLRAELAKSYGPVRLGNDVQRVRTVFKFAYEAGVIDKPTRFGPGFVKPNRAVLRKHRAKAGPRLLSADEVRAIVGAAGVPVRAMVLLGINCGFGNTDCGSLPLSALDLDAGWVAFARPKTGIPRRAKLWPETVAALRDALARRPEPKAATDAGLVFVTKYGRPWVKAGAVRADPVAQEFGKLLERVGVSRKGIGFYALRHTFRTAADSTKDANAIRLIMGHTDDRIDATYTHGIDDARLVAVADHVRAWLFPSENGGTIPAHAT